MTNNHGNDPAGGAAHSYLTQPNGVEIMSIRDKALEVKMQNYIDYGKTLENYHSLLTMEEEETRPLWLPPSFQTRSAPVYFEITLLTKENGALSKRISLNEDGTINADGSGCKMARGSALRKRIPDVEHLADLIGQLEPQHAIALGTLRKDLEDRQQVVTENRLAGTRGAIARTSDFIIYRPGMPAFALIDYDTKGMPQVVAARVKELGGFWGALLSVLPELKDVARVTRGSTSSGLTNGENGERLSGAGNAHTYIAIADGADAERFLKALHVRCWLAGLGWMMVGEAGYLLERSIVDRMVGGPERLVFEGGPILVAPLQQDKKARCPVAVDGGLLDTLEVCPPSHRGRKVRILQDEG